MAGMKSPPEPKRSRARAEEAGPSSAGTQSDARARNDQGLAKLRREKADRTERVAAAIRFNVNKAFEYGERALYPEVGEHTEAADALADSSTLTEVNASQKVGADAGYRADSTTGDLDRARVDSGGTTLTTNQGVQIAQNQDSLKAGLSGPALLEDFVLRDKITHFDHERIPERVVHARGSGAHGYFESYGDHGALTRASLFASAGKRTPVFVRFSTVVGERGSSDTARDVRGFAVKFYTDEGNWDLVGNNIPVFFIQDAMKFPDLVHAAKPEPHHQMPQAATAHDTFWDFVSLMPESAHMLMWLMSDRALPRSYRMMQGFGVHTFRFVNAEGESRFVKFHWNPRAGTHSLDWDEAIRISGADPDFHRRDLWEAIEAGAYPEFELGAQLFSESEADGYSFDPLDPTKIVPEELVPVTPLGRMVLNRNPDNFFAETEQVAFCVANIVPGIDFTNDPLLAGRIHSYVDTQITRLGGSNFHEIPINAPLAPIHNNQRDGLHRRSLSRGRVAYEPNSLAGGCPFQAGISGFTSVAACVAGDKVRGRPERFAEHYVQARLFWKSQTVVEKMHIIRAFRFELARVEVSAIRERVVAMLANVATELAERLAFDLGIAVPTALPAASAIEPTAEVEVSPALSLFARPGDGGIRTRRVAILVCDGVDSEAVRRLLAKLDEEGAVAHMVAMRLGRIASLQGEEFAADVPADAAPAVLYDALAIPGGKDAAQEMSQWGLALQFIREQYRHCKPILALGDARATLERAGVPRRLPTGELDPGLVIRGDDEVAAAIDDFVEAIAAHRHFARQADMSQDSGSPANCERTVSS